MKMPVSMGQPPNSFPHRQYLITPIQHSIFPFHLPINVEFSSLSLRPVRQHLVILNTSNFLQRLCTFRF